MPQLRRMGVSVLAFAIAILGLTWLLGGSASGQVVIQVQPGIIGRPAPLPGVEKKDEKGTGAKTSQFSAVKLIENSVYRQYINVARDSIKDKAWNDAVTALQKILDTKEDFYVQVREKDNIGREVLRWTSVKFEAQNLLGSMPNEGLEVYEQRYGGKALAMLKEARDTGNREVMAEVAHRWFHTRAGAEANDLLATMLLDRGQYFLAALRFERMLKLPAEQNRVNDLTLFKAALAYRRAGDLKSAGAIWQKLEDRIEGKEGIKIGDQTIALAKLRVVYTDDKQAISFGQFDWPMIRGNLSNNALAMGSPPLLGQPLWSRKHVLDNDPLMLEEGYHKYERETKAQIDSVLNNTANLITMPGFFPISANGRLIVRAYGELRCIALKADGDYKPGDTIWRSTQMDGSLNRLFSKSDLKETVNPWLANYLSFPGFASFLFENSLIGTLSTDHQNVYAIDDLAIPPPDNFLQPNQFMGGQQVNVPPKIRPLLMQNCLYAFSLRDGSAAWVLGSMKDGDPKDEFTDSHFLGPPLSIGGKLYVLNEKNQGVTGDSELRLVCIDPNKVDAKYRPQVVQPIQNLGSVEQRNRVTHAISRRINAVHLGYGEGILVCPTNAGEVLGVDLMSRSLAWAYPYRERAPSEISLGNGNQPINQPFMRNPSALASTVTVSKWKSTPPVIAEGKVVFTAPDADSVHCINLQDGTPRWKVGKLEGDLFMAGVVGHHVVLVGKNHMRALNLDDGRQLWALTTGDVPSGQGVASNGIYYLPLKKGEILAVDLQRGYVKAHNRSKNSGGSPGNLIFSEGAVISVSPYEATAYPQLLAKLEVADASLKTDPTNPDKLIARGEILLADGQVQKAVNDLHLALEQKLADTLDKRARNLLYEALTDLLQADFVSASAKYLGEYRELCQAGDTNQEKQLRQAKYFRIVGQGREAQGNLIDAFQNFKEFGSLPIHREMGGVASLDDPSHKVPVDVWLRGRVSAMFARATAEQRAPLEAKINEEWKAVEAKKDIDAIRAFVGMFDVPFNVGREARLRLADAILERNDQGSYLEAELSLYQLRGQEYKRVPASGGRALAGLALLEEKKSSAESMQAAAAYYRQLAREFPNDAVRQNKTGKDLFNHLAADKRLLPYLEESSSFWNQAPLVARDLNGIGGMNPNNQQIQLNVLHPEGEASPFLRRHRLVLETNQMNQPPKLTFVDVGTGKNRWGPLTLGGMPINMQMAHLYQANQFNHAANPNARFRFYQSIGHLAVVQVGVMVYCLDTDQGKILWQQSLLDQLVQHPNMMSQLMLDADGNMEMITYNQFNGAQRAKQAIGQIAAVQANYVALVTQKGLMVIDPLRGNVLWKKIDVSAGSKVFGDDQYLFVIEMGEGGSIGATRVLRASDGENVLAPNFTREYQAKVRVLGRRLLTNTMTGNQQTLRLYDIVGGKDIWAKPLEIGTVLTATEDQNLTGWVDPLGRLVALDAQTGEELLNTSVVQGRVSLDEVKNLRAPLLLADSERFYLALNKPVDASKVQGGVVMNNFHNGIRSRLVNGWVEAFHRQNGAVKVGRKTVTVAKGELAWHSIGPVENQMVVLEQFDQLPILLFTGRYNRAMPGGGNAWVAFTQALHKQTGKVPYDSGSKMTFNNFLANFVNLQADPRQGTINLIGHGYSVQIYVDDGRKVDLPQGLVVTSNLGPGPGNDFPIQPALGRVIRNRIIIQQAVPLPLVPALPERD